MTRYRARETAVCRLQHRLWTVSRILEEPPYQNGVKLHLKGPQLGPWNENGDVIDPVKTTGGKKSDLNNIHIFSTNLVLL